MSGVVMDRMKAGENDEVATFGGGPGEAGLGNGRGASVMSAHVAFTALGVDRRSLLLALRVRRADASRGYKTRTRERRAHLPSLLATMGVPSQSSAAGVLALLSDPEPVLKQYALKALNQLVPQFWAEISEHIALMYVIIGSSHKHLAHAFYHSESLYESDQLPKEAHDSAALLASKVYYYLGDYEEALSFALGAGSAFENDTRGPGTEEYVETIVCESVSSRCCMRELMGVIAKAIDRYIQGRLADQTEGKIDSRLQGIIEGIFRRCIAEGEYKQVRAVLTSAYVSFTNSPEGNRHCTRVETSRYREVDIRADPRHHTPLVCDGSGA